MKRLLLLLFALLLAIAGLAALFPAKALGWATGWYTVGLNISFENGLAAFGGGALIAACWALSSALRKRS